MLEEIETEITVGPKLKLDCPHCGVQQGPAASQEQRETLKFIGISLYAHRNTYVTCLTCKSRFVTRLRLQELQSVTELPSHLRIDISLASKALALGSVLVFCVPIVGLLMALIAFFLTPKKPNWVRKLSLFSIALSGIANAVWIFITITKLMQ